MSDCYVAFKPCGCGVAAVVISSDRAKDVAQSVAEWIADGLTIELRPVEWVRENLRRCPHVAEQTVIAGTEKETTTP